MMNDKLPIMQTGYQKELAELGFTDRDSYFKWREQWRSEYATVASEIRSLRNQMQGANYWGIEQALRELKRKQARGLMLARASSKTLAGAQWRAQHPERAGARVTTPEPVSIAA
jgi:hypothetical protein